MTTEINSSHDVYQLQEEIKDLKRDLRYINILLPNLVSLCASVEALKIETAALKAKTAELDLLLHTDVSNIYSRIEQIQNRLSLNLNPPPTMYN